MSDTDVLEKLADLKDKLVNAPEEDKETMYQWEKLIRKAFLVKNLYEHDAVKIIFQYFQAKVESINKALQEQTADELATPQGVVKRVRWEALREAYGSFTQILSRAEGTIKVINKNVDENL
ncbi:MAG: hypothetical protein UY18_C0017G0005 [Microgenomates group bacterium GW2011_GWF2_47_9]|nr:MAG: hypothetical protein UY18_C0017G0005 [Microgenomates group bacterium GW2011_GWF2_47_9]